MFKYIVEWKPKGVKNTPIHQNILYKESFCIYSMFHLRTEQIHNT